MKNLLTKNKRQKGYAILFTVVIVSALSIITAGLTNTAYKQLVLSSLAKDSQSAFYQADTAGDCALYADQVEYEGKYKATPTRLPSIFDSIPGTFTCGGLSLVITALSGNLNNGYSLMPQNENADAPCSRINVTKTIDAGGAKITTISAKGYNICNTNNLRTVEREILITLKEEPPV